MRIMVDLDGVIYPFVEQLREFAADFYERPIDDFPYPTEWTFHDSWGMSRRDFNLLLDEAVEAGWLFCDQHGYDEPIPGALEALEQLRRAGHTVHLATNRHLRSRVADSTYHWLTRNHVPYDSLTFAPDKTVLDCDVALDDSADNVQALRAAGVDAWLFTQPWNRLADLPKVANWREFVNVVSAATVDSWYRVPANADYATEPETVLEEANRLVGGDRSAVYGDPADDMARTARLWSPILGTRIQPWQVAACMVQLKIARRVHSPHRDAWVDVAGYAQVGAECDGV